MKEITIYSTAICPYCHAAKLLLKQLNLTYDEIRVDQNREERVTMMERSGRTSVPQIFFGEHHVGGFDDLHALHRSGKLEQLLAE